MRRFERVLFGLSGLFAVLGVLGCSANGPTEADALASAESGITISTTATYNIIGAGSNKCVDVVGASRASLAKLAIATCNGTTHQQFRAETTTGGAFRLRNVNSNLCLDVNGASLTDGAAIIQFACGTGTNQAFTFTDVANGERITARHSGKVLDVTANGTADGTLLEQWTSNNGLNQQFRMQVVGATSPSRVRILPLGDSTTGSVCWRALLWQMLNQSGRTGRFDFVGSRHNDPGCGVAGYDQDNEGHPGVLINNFVVDADEAAPGTQTPQALLGQNPADIVLLHFATNDIWNRISNQTILANYTSVLSALRRANPNVTVLAAQLIPMAPSEATCPGCTCSTCAAQIASFNSSLPGWAQANRSTASPIIVVDQNTGFNASTDTVDGVHPNNSGSTKIASKWLQALSARF